MIKLQSATSKLVCIDCFCVRHPKTALDLIEKLLDKEEKGG